MKYLSFLLVLLCTTLSAQTNNSPQSSLVESALINYEYCLNHSNTGVVESAIGNVLRFKHCYPQADMTRIEACLEKICKKNAIPKLRCRAYIASKILKDSALIAQIQKDFYENPDHFFAILSIGAGIQHTDKQIVHDYFYREHPEK